MAEGVTVTPKAAPVTTDSGFTANETAPLIGFLNAEPGDTRLQTIVDFFKVEGKDLLEADMLSQLRSLETKLGLPRLGETRIDKVYRYIKLQAQIDNLSKQRDGELR